MLLFTKAKCSKFMIQEGLWKARKARKVWGCQFQERVAYIGELVMFDAAACISTVLTTN
jgi:hypothetical protein